MRIISGKYGGRKLEVPKTQNIRPTSDKIRGSIFNALQSRIDLEATNVLDVFCGTGALGLEALSRGASTCIFIDKSKDSLSLTQKNANNLGAQNCCTFINQPIEKIKEKPSNFAAANLFFCDPPYHQDLLPAALEALHKTGWLAPDSLGILECEKPYNFTAPQRFEILNEKIYGDTKIIFVKN